MLVRLLKQMLVWIYPRYAGSKGQLCNTGEENGYWINGTTAHLTATAKALENFFSPCLPKKRRWSLSCLFSTPFSLPSYPVSIAPSLPILFFSICPFPLIFSHTAIALVFLLYLLSRKRTAAVVPALHAVTPLPAFIFLPAQAQQFHLSAALLRLPQQGAASALKPQYVKEHHGREASGHWKGRRVTPTAVSHSEGHSRESSPLPANLVLSLVLWKPLNEGLIFPASHYFLKIGPREWVSAARRKK